MVTQWYFQLNNQTFGPLPPSEIKHLAEKGTILEDTLVRKGEDGPWVFARAVKGLCFPQEEEARVKTKDVEEVGQVFQGIVKADRRRHDEAVRRENTDLVAQSKAGEVQEPTSRSAVASQWYYQLNAKTFGPVRSSEIKRLVEKGDICQDTLVRKGQDGHWVLAELLKGLHFREIEKALAEAKDVEQEKDQCFQGITDVPVRTDDKTLRGEVSPPECYVQTVGGTLGPLDLQPLQTMASTSEITCDPLVCRVSCEESLRAETLAGAPTHVQLELSGTLLTNVHKRPASTAATIRDRSEVWLGILAAVLLPVLLLIAFLPRETIQVGAIRTTPKEAALFLLILFLSLYEEIVELIRRRWAFCHAVFAPLRVVYNVFTCPKYALVPLAKISASMGTAGATPLGRLISVMGALFVCNVYWLFGYISPVRADLVPADSDARAGHAMGIAFLFYLGRVIIGGYADDANPLHRFKASYMKPIRSPFYKELTLLLIGVFLAIKLAIW